MTKWENGNMTKQEKWENGKQGDIPESNDSVQARQVSLAKGASQVLALHGRADGEDRHDDHQYYNCKLC